MIKNNKRSTVIKMSALVNIVKGLKQFRKLFTSLTALTLLTYNNSSVILS